MLITMDTNAVQSVPKIMVVEDDPHVLRQIAFALEHEGYAVTTATAGDDALRQLMLDRPDLLVTDVMMPGLDGYDLVDQLRRDEKLCDLPVIMVTARTADEDISKGFSSGTDIYIEKPFKPSELVAFVRRFVGPAKPDAHP
jgi:two-component system phosphate regulon response regulator PhoB